MSKKKKMAQLAILMMGVLLILVGLSVLKRMDDEKHQNTNINTYGPLTKDTQEEDPLAYIGENYEVKDGFHTKLPIVVLEYEGDEMPDYKHFKSGVEYLEDEEPYTTGKMTIINGGKENHLTDKPQLVSELRLKARGHTSYDFNKKQYLLKLETKDNEKNPQDVLGMGSHDTWILNGSSADRSMLRNYLAYRITSEISDVTPDSQYCEVIIKKGDQYTYQGLYLMMESVARDENRVNIDTYKKKNIYTSYIVRRDRFTHFDRMLDTYGRLEGISNEWIGLKYPSEDKITDEAIKYIEDDFSKIEKVLYSDDEDIFRTYDKYIDINSFVDYFLINEFFGNYDAGEHSTYMYKNSGEPLKIGPVWDFDQAMNNYFDDDLDSSKLAFQEREFFKQLCQDMRFVKLLEKRYIELRKTTLNIDHVNETIDDIKDYIDVARQREWYRWKEDYEDETQTRPGVYHLLDFEDSYGDTISRLNTDYDQEIYVIKTYLYKHGRSMETELKLLEKSTIYDTSYKDYNDLFLYAIMIVFLLPSVIIIRRG